MIDWDGREQHSHRGTDRASDAAKQPAILGHLHQTEKERHHADEPDGHIDGVARGGEDGVGHGLHLARERAKQDGDQNDDDEDAVEHLDQGLGARHWGPRRCDAKSRIPNPESRAVGTQNPAFDTNS